MVLKLDPRFPLVWRSPSSLQLGVSDPPVVFERVSAQTEAILAGLSVGLTRPGLKVIGSAVGLSDRQLAALLTTLSPVLAPATPAQSNSVNAASVLLVGTGETARLCARLLAENGMSVKIAADASAAAGHGCDLAIAVGHFVLEPELFGLWLRRDLPHLAVILSDSEVIVGPFVEPGTGPCLYCLNRYSNDADPAWPAIASQLFGRRSPADTSIVASQVAAIVCRLTRERVAAGAAASTHSSVHVNVRTGNVSTREWQQHPSCGCTVAGWTNAEVPLEIGSVAVDRPARRRHSRRWPPKKVPSAFSRG
jgi:bacteriocin biosynthesis cyclodehydratase domain-containing protein